MKGKKGKKTVHPINLKKCRLVLNILCPYLSLSDSPSLPLPLSFYCVSASRGPQPAQTATLNLGLSPASSLPLRFLIKSSAAISILSGQLSLSSKLSLLHRSDISPSSIAAPMGETNDDGGYWLPAHFLPDSNFFKDGETLTKDSIQSTVRRNVKTPEGYYVPFYSSSALNSPVESVVSFNETDGDQDVFVAELTRQFAESSVHDTCTFSCGSELGARTFCGNQGSYTKSTVMGSSPESTLIGFGGWAKRGKGHGLPQVSSLATPLGANPYAWELIYAAAGQVARLKINAQLQQNRGLLAPPRNHYPVAKTPDIGGLQSIATVRPEYSQINQIQKVKQPAGSIWGLRQGMEEGWYSQQMQTRSSSGGCFGAVEAESGRCGGAFGHSAWPTLRGHQHPHSGSSDIRAVALGGSDPVVKKKSTGTGFFLPCRPAEPRMKSGCSTVLLPTRVVQAPNLNLEEMTSSSQPCFVNGYNPYDDILLARRNAIFAQHKRRNLTAERSWIMAQETRLPQDWTY